jgi:hypothetical protein
MADPNKPVREVMSRGAISIDETMTLRSLAAVLAELDIGVAVVARKDASASFRSGTSCARLPTVPTPTRSGPPMS